MQYIILIIIALAIVYRSISNRSSYRFIDNPTKRNADFDWFDEINRW